MIDLHVHTHHSDDSKVSMEQYCKKAIEIGVKYLCFTDHVDNNPADPGSGKFNADSYFEEFYKVKEKYKDKLILLSGVEFSEPHIYQKEFDKIRQYPFDYIIGSIHFFYNDMLLSKMVQNNIPIDIVYENYWNQMQQMVEYGGFDAIGHFDFPKRYFNKLIYDEKRIEIILNKAVKNNLILEINTSSLRKGCSESMPSNDILDIYYKVGGRKVTVGADTHRLEELSKDVENVIDSVKDRFEIVFFNKRKEVKFA